MIRALVLADCREALAAMEPGSVDAVVTDPPYELGFMGKSWDAAGVSFDPRTWWAVMRVLKPGGHLLAFGGTRTFHRIGVAIEDAGFEIRDTLSWLYGSGFPKSHNIGDGWGTALKPAWEPVIVARKPLAGTVAQNVAQHGTGALNIDGCRIPHNEPCRMMAPQTDKASMSGNGKYQQAGRHREVLELKPAGRWPANVALDEDAAALLDEQSGERPGMKPATLRRGATTGRSIGGEATYGGAKTQEAAAGYADSGGASRFFYTAKASRSERNAGLNDVPERFLATMGDGIGNREHNPDAPGAMTKNHHPTVKPVSLMRWLVRLVTPPGGTVLDPFAGSGTTGVACAAEGFGFIGIERDPEYLGIASRRIVHALREADG